MRLYKKEIWLPDLVIAKQFVIPDVRAAVNNLT